jgi:MFS family permease
VQPIHLIAVCTLLVQGAHMGSRVVASLLALRLGANAFEIGALIAVYSLFPLLLSFHSGRVSDRFGPVRPMVAGTLVVCAGLLIPVAWRTLAALYLSAALVGIGFTFYNVSNQNIAGALGSPAERTRNFAILGLGYAAAHFAGPVAAGHSIEHFGFEYGYALFALAALVPAVLLSCDRRLDIRPAGAAPPRRNALELMEQPPLRRAIVVSALTTTGFDLYGFYVPIYGHSIGLAPSTIGNLLGAFAAATFVVRIVLPRLTSRFGIEGVLAAAVLGAALLFLVFPFVSYVPLLFALSFLIGLALGCGQPLTLNLAYNHSPAGRSGEVTGLRLMLNNLTHFVVPLGAGAVGALLGVAPVFWVSAAVLVASGHLTLKGPRA